MKTFIIILSNGLEMKWMGDYYEEKENGSVVICKNGQEREVVTIVSGAWIGIGEFDSVIPPETPLQIQNPQQQRPQKSFTPTPPGPPTAFGN
jgi:hypothetical protein